MSGTRILLSLVAAALTFLLHATPAAAQATRTWVSGVGDDANPCTRTAPCKTFAGAISKTAAGGEISVLDPGGFGAVTITKSISIVARGAEGSILGSFSNGVIVNAGPNDQVYLEGLSLEGAGTGLNGIRFLAGARLTVNDCVIRGFRSGTGFGIDFQSSTADSRLDVVDTLIEANLGGIQIKTTGTTINQAFFTRVVINRNGSLGIRADGQNAGVSLMDSVVSGALTTLNGGDIRSFGNNALYSGSPSQTLPLQ